MASGSRNPSATYTVLPASQRSAAWRGMTRSTETGKFVRTIRLPKAVEANKIEATYQDGILVVRLPKIEPAIKNKILIKG